MGYFLERVFPLCHVRFISVDDHYDSAEHDGDTGGLDVAFKFLIHEQYSKDLSRKITAAKHERMRRGEHIMPFFGYRKVNNQLVIDEAAAETVRHIYTLALEGKNYGQIAEVMYAEKRKTPAAHKKGAENFIWSKSKILEILRGEQYAGTYLAGKSRTLEIGSGKKIKVDEAEWIRIENHHPAIINKTMFEAVQAVLDQKRQPLRNRKLSTNQRYSKLRVPPLKGKVFCGFCGHAMRLSMTENAAFHCQHTLAAPDAPCHKLKINASELEKTVLRKLREQATSTGEEEADLPQPISRYAADKAALEDEKCNLYERYVVGKLSAEDYKAAASGLTQEIEDLRHTHIAIAAQAKKQSAKLAGSIALKNAAEALKGRRTLTAELAAGLIDKVKISPDGSVEIEWKVEGAALAHQ